jgi:hypothetical protein
MTGPSPARRAAVAVLAAMTLGFPAAAPAKAPQPTALHVAAAGKRTLTVAWSPGRRHAWGYRLHLGGRKPVTTRRTTATFRDLECGRAYTVKVQVRSRHGGHAAVRTVVAATAPCETVNLATRCSGQNCDGAFANLQPGNEYYLPAGVWRFTRPLVIPSNVTVTGDGTGLTGTDLVYSGPPVAGAAVVAGTPGRDWVNGHLAGVEIETDQLHALRVANADTASAMLPIGQAATGLEVVNPTESSTVANVNVWKFGNSSVRIDNHAASPGKGVFQFSDFFVGTSPHAFDVDGSSAQLLIRYGGIDLGPLSQLGMQFTSGRAAATSVVESVKLEGDYDVPGYVVAGGSRVVFVGTTRYLEQSLYTDTPFNSAPAFLARDSSAGANALQCLGCTALGERSALALPRSSQKVPTDKWGIDLHRLTPAGAHAVESALATPETPGPRPHDVVNLASQCVQHNCDAALANLKFSGRYYLPAGVWTFSRPFTVPETATFFGDGPQGTSQGGTTLRYVGAAIPGDAAVLWGAGGGDMSGRLFSLRIDTNMHLDHGFGIRARDATNAASIEDIAVGGFPDGQLLLDATPADQGSGPNFVRVTRFSLTGGAHPLQVDGGRQTLLLEQGTIQLGPTSQEGLNMIGGDQLAATRVVNGVSVIGDRDVPGFRVRSPAVTDFIGSSRKGGAGMTAPGFIYTALVPRQVTECLGCSVSGTKSGFAMPQLGVDVPARRDAGFDYMNPNTAAVTTHKSFNNAPPTIGETATVGAMLTSAVGQWAPAPSGFAYQWVRCKRPDVPSNPATRCTPIPGADQPTYTVTSADTGFLLRVSVTATNSAGAESATSLSTLAR